MCAAATESVTTRNGGSVDKIKKYGWQMVAKPGVPFLAKKGDLKIDTTYQRTMISEPRVLSIAQAWSWVACGSLIVAERADKTLWVVDGQHRAVAAMRRSDILELPCLVFHSEGPEEEARAFYRANCIRGNVSPYDKLRALLACGDQLARDAVELIQAHGYEPSAGDAQNTIRCIARFMSAIKADRGVLEKVWPLVAELHKEAGSLPIRVRVLNALLYIGKFGNDDITAPTWRKRALKQGLVAIAAAIDRACAVYVQAGPRVCAQGALDVINKGVRMDSRIGLNEGTDGDDD
jgi:hypothetical protein